MNNDNFTEADIESVLHGILPLSTEHLKADDIANIASDLYLALTEPTRPEGAEELDALVDASIRGCSDITSPETVQTISNGLAESGVRVVTEEQEPTDAEVEAAANALADWDGADWHAETWDGEIPREAYRAGARRALSAARAVGRGAR